MTSLRFYGHQPSSIEGGELPGRLIVLEGTDGVGRSTQIALLTEWLEARGYAVVSTGLRRSDLAGRGIARAKRGNTLDPLTLSLFYAADFWDRLERRILPALQAGAVVLADRYVYTAYARDAARGVDRAWLRRVYSFAPRPTVAFYFDVPLDEAVRRILTGRPELKYYEAGLDLGLSPDPYESFRLFQVLIREEYGRLVEEFNLVRIDATDTLVNQQQRMRALVEPVLAGVMRTDPTVVARALSTAGLVGSYLGGGGAARRQEITV